MKKKIILLMIFLSLPVILFIDILIAVKPIQSSPARIKLEIQLEDSFLENEPVWVEFRVINLEKKAIRIKPLELWVSYGGCPIYFQIDLIDQKGNQLRYWGPEAGYSDSLFEYFYTEIDSGKIYSTFIDLLASMFGQPVKIKGISPRMGWLFLPSGKYKLRAKYIDKSDMIVSNEVQFEVKKPEGKDAEACELYLKTYRYLVTRPDLAIPFLQEIVEKFPQSAYAEATYFVLARSCGRAGYLDKALIYEIDALKKFPNSGFAQSTFSTLLNHIRQKPVEKQIELLHSISDQFPGTKAGNLAKEALKKLEK